MTGLVWKTLITNLLCANLQCRTSEPRVKGVSLRVPQANTHLCHHPFLIVKRTYSASLEPPGNTVKMVAMLVARIRGSTGSDQCVISDDLMRLTPHSPQAGLQASVASRAAHSIPARPAGSGMLLGSPLPRDNWMGYQSRTDFHNVSLANCTSLVRMTRISLSTV